MTADEIAAGAVIWRQRPGEPAEPEILLIHRPKYDDWSFPKGKLDPGEHLLNAAVREVKEETGLSVTLGRTLPPQRYQVGRGRREERADGERTKTVYYWQAHVVATEQAGSFPGPEAAEPDDEVDDLAWVPLSQATRVLTHPGDQNLLTFFRPTRTTPLVILRHAAATPRAQWSESDDHRPLTTLGTDQASRLIPALAAYGITDVVSSPSTRCQSTVRGYAETIGAKPRLESELNEGVPPEHTHQILRTLLSKPAATVVCTHRPTLPSVFEALGVPATALEPADFLVLHRPEQGDGYLALEQHRL